jgi:acyl carrier protein
MDTTTAIEAMAMEKLNVSAERLHAAVTFEEAGIDSLSAIDLVFAVEAHFGVLIDADDLNGVHSLKDLIALVDALVNGGAQARAA